MQNPDPVSDQMFRNYLPIRRCVLLFDNFFDHRRIAFIFRRIIINPTHLFPFCIQLIRYLFDVPNYVLPYTQSHLPQRMPLQSQVLFLLWMLLQQQLLPFNLIIRFSFHIDNESIIVHFHLLFTYFAENNTKSEPFNTHEIKNSHRISA